MIEGLIRHDTEMRVEKNFVDSHGQSEVAFAFCHLLGSVRLMPRLKPISMSGSIFGRKGSPRTIRIWPTYLHVLSVGILLAWRPTQND
jgi:hypothetical protein